MGKNKYDWQKLEYEFLVGDDLTISDFFRKKKLPESSYTYEKTKGWLTRKQEFYRKIAGQILETKKQELEHSTESLLKARKNTISVMINTLQNFVSKDGKTKTAKLDDLRSLKILWEVLSVMTGNPTSFQRFEGNIATPEELSKTLLEWKKEVEINDKKRWQN